MNEQKYVCGKNKDNAKISQATLTTRKPGFPFHSIRASQTRQRQQQVNEAAQVAAASSASATASAAASIYEPTACGKHNRNRKRQQAAAASTLVATLSSSAVTVICIKWQPLVGAPHLWAKQRASDSDTPPSAWRNNAH